MKNTHSLNWFLHTYTSLQTSFEKLNRCRASIDFKQDTFLIELLHTEVHLRKICMSSFQIKKKHAFSAVRDILNRKWERKMQ